jgi:hypothetical protein
MKKEGALVHAGQPSTYHPGPAAARLCLQRAEIFSDANFQPEGCAGH